MKSVAQEERKVKPILPTTPSHSTDRTTSRTTLTSLKPAEELFFSSSSSFCFPSFPLNSFFLSVLLSVFIPSSFNPLPLLFLLPAFFYLFCCLILVKKFFLILPPIFLYSYCLPSFPFLFPFSFLLSFFFFAPFLFFPQVRQDNLEC